MAVVVNHPPSAAANAARSPLALWHLLSLDAPAVAALWTWFFAKVFARPVRAEVPLTLALAVWMLYSADRISDASRGSLLEERHRFHMRHRCSFLIVMACIGPLLFLLIARLPLALRRAWLLLSLPLLLYVVLVHGLHLRRVPKEAVVGVFFGLATALPALAAGTVPVRLILPSMLLFAGLCWLNGIAIHRWEHAPLASTDPCTAWLARRPHLAGAALGAAGLVLLALPRCGTVSLAVLLSVCGLLCVERARSHLDRVHVRALADAALLTPLALWPFLPLLMPR